MFKISLAAKNLLPALLLLSFISPYSALAQVPTVNDHDIEIIDSPFQAGQGFGLASQLGRSAFSNIPYVGGGIPYVSGIGVPRIGIPVPSLNIPYVGGFGGLGSIGGLIGRSWGRSYSSGYGLGSGYGYGSGFGYSLPSNYSWARPFGRLSGSSVIQTAPSKAAGNYYAPSTVDPSAAGSYYASQSQPVQSHSVFDKDYNDYVNYKRSRPSYGNSDHTKPQKNYWGGSGSPFPQDLNSTPWSK